MTDFKEWFNDWDFPISLNNPLLRIDKRDRLEFLEEIAVHAWDY